MNQFHEGETKLLKTWSETEIEEGKFTSKSTSVSSFSSQFLDSAVRLLYIHTSSRRWKIGSFFFFFFTKLLLIYYYLKEIVKYLIF